MPIQKFAPMTKDFPTFDCDAHVTEPPWIWERAKDWLTKDELEALKTTMWYDAETKQLIVNGHGGMGLGSQRIGGTPGVVNVLTSAGPGLKHNIQRAFNVRNLNPKTAIFFMAFLPQFIDAAAAFPVWLQFVILGTIVNLMFSSADIVCVFLAGVLIARLRRSGRAQRLMQRAGGAVLVGLGVHVALQRS